MRSKPLIPVRDILISTCIFISFVILAVGSQIISPTPVAASKDVSNFQAQIIQTESKTPQSSLFELDPDDPNPTLFAMAPEENDKNNISSLGGPLETDKERLTSTGLRITDLKVGDGPEATAGQTVSVNYRGTLENGKEFDSSYERGPFTFPLGSGRVIKGWDEGVEGMKVGGKRKLVIPPDLGYGSRGAGRVIPPNSTLIFEVELLDAV